MINDGLQNMREFAKSIIEGREITPELMEGEVWETLVEAGLSSDHATEVIETIWD